MVTGVLRADKGVATNIGATLLGDRYMQTCKNVNMVKRGVVTSRVRGWSKQRASAFNGGVPFLDFGIFVAANGTRTLLFQVGDDVDSYNIGTSTETVIFTGVSNTALPCFRAYAPYAAGTPYTVWCNGSDEPRKITSVTASSLLQLNGANYGAAATAAPLAVKTYSKPTFVEPYLDRLVLAKFAGSGTEYDVVITNAGTGETCTQSAPLVATDGGVFTMNPALGAITGLKAFKLSNESNEQVLLVAQALGVTLITGEGATTFRSRQLTDEYGIPSNRTWVRVMNDLYFLASDGIRCFSTLIQNSNLLTSSKTFGVQDLVNRWNQDQLAKAHAFHMRKYQEIVFWFPIDVDTDCKNAFVFNYGDSDNEPAIFPKDGTTVTCSTLFSNIPYGGGSDGVLQLHYSGTKYGDAAVAFRIALSPVHAEGDSRRSFQADFQIITEGPANKFIPNCYGFVRTVSGKLMRKRMLPANQVKVVSDAAGSILDSWALGVGAYPSEHTRITTFKPKGAAHMMDLELTGTDADHDIDFVAAQFDLKLGGVNQ